MLAIAPPGRQACTTTTIRWKLTPDADPFVRETVQQVALWIDMWPALKKGSNMSINLKTSWNHALSRVYLPVVNWKKVTGPIAATIGALSRAGWKPSYPNLWYNRAGD